MCMCLGKQLTIDASGENSVIIKTKLRNYHICTLVVTGINIRANKCFDWLIPIHKILILYKCYSFFINFNYLAHMMQKNCLD